MISGGAEMIRIPRARRTAAAWPSNPPTDDPVYDDTGTACIVPSVTAVIRGQDGGILLVHKTDNNLWALPGGARRASGVLGAIQGGVRTYLGGPDPPVVTCCATGGATWRGTARVSSVSRPSVASAASRRSCPASGRT
jgi:hypothetical protein